MGIINVTNDSFSGDGIGYDPEVVTEQALKFQDEGADFIDVGGESTRPPGIYNDVKKVTAQEEIKRIAPVIKLMSSKLNIPISIDTYKSDVARCALESGAALINDIWGLKSDSGMIDVVVDYECPIIVMHNQENSIYHNLIKDIKLKLGSTIELAVMRGIKKENIILDPGIGFGKTPEQNIDVMKHLDEFGDLGHPLLIGTSRKSFIGHVLDVPIGDRLEGTAATVALAIRSGVDIVRVHDVKEMAKVSKMADAIIR
ncbi:dihydropteroate synthase [bacterium]|nr:dihydropteroate synthase [bacterium]